MNIIHSDEVDHETVKKLVLEIIHVFERHDLLTHAEALTACLNYAGNVLISIPCPHCREIATQNFKAAVTNMVATFAMVAEALADAAEQHDGAPPPSQHVH